MQLHLRDLNPAVVAAWREFFGSDPNVTISEGDILELEGDAIVSPANSFGWMDGGIDLAYRQRFGAQVEERLQRRIATWCHEAGEALVGTSIYVDTRDDRIPLLIAAPTMRVPEPVPHTVNAFLAMRAALGLTSKLSREGGWSGDADNSRAWPANYSPTLLCPGLCTFFGGMPPRRAAFQMASAWGILAHRPSPAPAEVIALHRAMLEVR